MGKGKKLKNAGPNTAGAKAKAQKKASRQQKDEAKALQKKKQEDASWSQGSNKRAAEKARMAAEKQRQKEATRLAKEEARAEDVSSIFIVSFHHKQFLSNNSLTLF